VPCVVSLRSLRRYQQLLLLSLQQQHSHALRRARGNEEPAGRCQRSWLVDASRPGCASPPYSLHANVLLRPPADAGLTGFGTVVRGAVQVSWAVSQNLTSSNSDAQELCRVVYRTQAHTQIH
jgi:hypothetical protein